MPNWCYNQVDFSGAEKDLKKVTTLFLAMSAREGEEGQGQKPDFLGDEEPEDSYFFDINADEFEDGYDTHSITYNTKWVPNLNDVLRIANHFNVDFEHQYEELGMQLYGKYRYQDKVLNHKCLEDADLSRFDWSGDEVLFDGEPCESEAEQLETLLESKEYDNNTDNS